MAWLRIYERDQTIEVMEDNFTEEIHQHLKYAKNNKWNIFQQLLERLGVAARLEHCQ